MTLTPSQLYFIKRAKERRTNVILGILNRKYGRSTCNKKIVKFRMNEKLHQQFYISRLADLNIEQYEEYLQAIQTFQLEYNGELIG